MTYLPVDRWDRVCAHRCDICAALVANPEDLQKHLEWHEKANVEARRQ